MAYITLNKEKLRHNFDYLDALFRDHAIQWSVVTKMLCGHTEYLQELLALPINQVCDSRVSNLRTIKQLKPTVETIYIKPPAKRALKGIVRYADVSMNTDVETIKLLSEEAQRQGKIHKIIIMVELGELREGVMRNDLVDFYEQVFRLQNIEVIGIGANLSCLYGVLPSHDKLIQLSLYKQLIEARFAKNITYVSGGSSVTIPLVLERMLPAGINHFRVGETLFLGTDVYHDRPLDKLVANVFMLYAEIIEINEKPLIPDGEMGTNIKGDITTFDSALSGQTSCRAIVDVGILDVEEKNISPVDSTCVIVGGSSDMFVLDLHDNPSGYQVGDMLAFRLNYLGVLRIMHSKYIDKRIC